MAMRNRDQPASGIPDSEISRGPDTVLVQGALGLTKREAAAIAIMASLVREGDRFEIAASRSTRAADRLFDALDGDD